MSTIRTRIAPSPTGFPHIGTVFQALFDYVYAKKYDGQFIIRVEDTDQARKVEGAEAALFDTLEYYGLTPDEGPRYGGDYGPYRQSERLDIYQKYAQELLDKGHAYYCFCTPERLDQVRKDKQKAGLPPMYDRHCRAIDPAEAAKRTASEKYVIRMKVPDNEKIVVNDVIRGEILFDSGTVDDQVLMKSDGYPTYHLAVVVDDHLMAITHMVRGEEWISSAPKHVLLYRYFGWNAPVMIHTPLLRNPDRSKLSKRHGHTSAQWYQEAGYLPEAVINFLATRVWNHPDGSEVFPLSELIKHFDFANMHIQGPIVDLNKLNWLNGQWIRSLNDKDLVTRLTPFMPKGLTPIMLISILPLIRDRLNTLADLPDLSDFFVKLPPMDEKLLLKESKMTANELVDYLQSVKDIVSNVPDFSPSNIESACRQLQEKLGLKPRPAFMSLRLAVTGKAATPPLFDVMSVLGKNEVISRLDTVVNSINK